MKLASGLIITEPRKLICAFVEHWYDKYDGVPVAQDSEFQASDIAISTMLMSRISGVTGGYILRVKEPIEDGLARIPPNLDLLDVPAGDEIPGAEGISQAITAICAVPRAKLAATKILHKKRPGLIYIFDSVVKNHYAPSCPSVSDRTWGDYAIALTRLVHSDILSAASQLRELQAELKENKTPMAPSRILNALTWIVCQNLEEWILKQPDILKRKRRMPLKFTTSEMVVEYVEKVVELLEEE
jgi:hypothetical protein